VPGDALWIDGGEALAAYVRDIGRGPLALDTEADSFHHYREKVCLVQLAAGGRFALVDPFSAGGLGALAAPLSDPGIRKILHGADYDIRLLHRDGGLTVSHLYDTMIAARLSGERAVGLAALLSAHLGIEHDKGQQRADWSRRPLTEPMRAYAIADVSHLEELATILEERVASLGRTAWVEEECKRLEDVRWRDHRDDDPEPFRRVKGAGALPPRALAILRELWAWRDAAARRRDRPAFRIVRDEVLVALSRTPPATIADLAEAPGFPDALRRSPTAEVIVDAVRRGVDCDADAVPQARGTARPRMEPDVEACFVRLRQGRDRIAAALELEPSVLASRSIVEEMARRITAGRDPWEAGEIRRWQRAVLGPIVA
jgi:ribonuclease D